MSIKNVSLLLLASLLPFINFAQNTTLDQYMKAQDSVNGFTGAVLVAKQGKIIYQKAFGQANREWNLLNTLDTRFPIASITKQFTAAAILQLEEQGKLSLEDKLDKYYPEYPKGDSITIHMLLNHTSGISNVTENLDFFKLDLNKSIADVKDIDLLHLFKNRPMDFDPGTFWKYGNSGYMLLSFIIEKTSGLTFRDYMHQHILKKAEMKNTDLFSYDSIIPNWANGYSRNAGQWKNANLDPINHLLGAGGLFSTVEDLFKWSEALHSGRIINQKSLAKMIRPNHEPNGYGYGLFIDRSLDRKVIYHGGGINGYNSYMVRYPDDELTIIILTNRDTNLDFIPKGIAGILLGKKVLTVYKHVPAKIDTANLERYAGEYEGDGVPYPLLIVEKDSKLYLRFGEDIELVPESENKFFINQPDVDIQLVFEQSPGNKSDKMQFIEGGIRYELIRKGKI